MLYLLWGLLNISLFLAFIVICMQAIKLIRVKMGFWSSVLFVVGVVSFAAHSTASSHDKKSSPHATQHWQFLPEDSLRNRENHEVYINMEKTLVSHYDLSIAYKKDLPGKGNIPVSAYSSLSGFVSGIQWRPQAIVVNQTGDPSRLEYSVAGMREWQLLGITLYSQSRHYSGYVTPE